MGFGGISIWELLIVLAIVITIFGAGRLRTLGSDLGTAIRGFQRGMRDDDSALPGGDQPADTTGGQPGR